MTGPAKQVLSSAYDTRNIYSLVLNLTRELAPRLSTFVKVLNKMAQKGPFEASRDHLFPFIVV